MFIYLFYGNFFGMVISDKALNRKGDIHFHFCSVCGVGYLNFEEALVCEEGHKRNVGSSGSVVVDDVVVDTRESKRKSEDPVVKPSSADLVKYSIVVREAFRCRVHSFSVEAPDIRAAADIVRARFPRHNGYEIKSAG